MTQAQKIKDIFHDADIEGLIANGAPNNEYDSEALEALRAISALRQEKVTEDNLAAVIGLIWARSFNRDENEMKMRLPAIHRIAQKLLNS